MSKTIDELLTKLPLWLGQFTRTLTHPSQVLTEQLNADTTAGAPTEAKPVQDGVGFLILSFAVAAGVSIAFPVPSMAPLEAGQAEGALTQSATVLRNLFVFLGAAALETVCLVALSLWLAWVWWRYLRISGLTPTRALAASAIGSAGLSGGYLLLTLIDGGQMSSELMQRCA